MIKEEEKLSAQQMLIMVAHFKDTGYRIKDTKYRIQDTGHRIQDTGFRI